MASGAILRGTVVDSRGTLVRGAGVVVHAQCTGVRERHRPLSADGSFEWKDLPPGEWWISASGPGWSECVRSVTILPDGVIRSIELVLEGHALVRIHVSTPDGEPFLEKLGGPYAAGNTWHPVAIATLAPLADHALFDPGLELEEVPGSTPARSRVRRSRAASASSRSCSRRHFPWGSCSTES